MRYGKLLRKVGPIITIPSIFVAGPLIGYFIGIWLDQHYAIDPWGKVLLTLFGFAASIQQVILIIRFWSRENNQDENNQE